MFSVLSVISRQLSFSVRVFSLPIAFLNAAAAYTSFEGGSLEYVCLHCLIIVISVVLFFVSPGIDYWIICTRQDLKETLFFPIVVRPKHRFTVDKNY